MYSPVHILEAGSNSRGVKRWGGGDFSGETPIKGGPNTK